MNNKFNLITRNVLDNQIVYSLVDEVKRAEVVKFAYSMAYVTLLSLVPSLAAIFGLIDLFTPILGANSGIVVDLREFLIKHLAPGSGEQLANTMTVLLDSLHFSNIGVTGLLSLIVTLVLLLANIEKAFNKIFEVEKHRNLITRFIYFWTFITLGSFVFFTGVGFAAGRLFHLDTFHNGNWYLSAIVYRVSFFTLIFLLYKVVPNRFVSAKSAAVGAVVTSILFIFAFSIFKLYPIYFKSLEVIYGALVALPLLLIWLHIVWVIVLFGAIVCHRVEIGFHVIKGNSLDTENIEDKYRSLEIRRSLPRQIFSYIYNVQTHPRGVKFERVVENFQSPIVWLEESVELLKELDIVHSEKSPKKRLFPSCRDENEARLVLDKFEDDLKSWDKSSE